MTMTMTKMCCENCGASEFDARDRCEYCGTQYYIERPKEKHYITSGSVAYIEKPEEKHYITSGSVAAFVSDTSVCFTGY